MPGSASSLCPCELKEQPDQTSGCSVNVVRRWVSSSFKQLKLSASDDDTGVVHAICNIRHHRSYSPSPSTIFLVWRLWNCSSLVPVLPIIQILLCQSFWPLLPTSSSLLRCPSRLRPGPITFYPLYHTPKPPH